MNGGLPDLVLTLFAIVAGIGALIAAIVALPRALVIVGHTIRAIFRWAVAAVRAVAVISDLPNRLDRIDSDSAENRKLIADTKSDLAEHVESTRVGRQEWGEMRVGLKQLLSNQALVVHELRHNGGTSVKDAVRRIEDGVAGLYARPGENGGPGREHETA